ncbi:MAG TPA: aldo/keto reductase [Polyangia bacterium]|jgi:hypothetical protein
MADDGAIARRRFLELTGIAAGALTAGCAGAVPPPQTPATPPPAAPATKNATPAALPTRVLGRTGLKVPIVSMGVMNADNPNLVRAALDGGIVLLDTAHRYQNGRNEEMIGTVLKGRKRDSFIVCTKVVVSGLDRATGIFAPHSRPEDLAEKLEISLTRLGLDHVDLFHLHGMSLRASALHPGMLAALAKLKQAGKTRFIGLSTHKNEPEVIRAAVEAKVYDVVLTSYNFKQEHHEEVRKAIVEAARAGLGILAMKTQAGVYWDKAKQHPIDMKAALRWALRVPEVHTAIPGFTTADQLALDLEVLRHPTLTDADLKSLQRPAGALAGFYCQGCERCLGQCREGLAVPEIMRSYMYAHAYRNREAAHDLMRELALPAAPCGSCDECAVTCPHGLDVRDRVRDIARIRTVPREFLV